MLKEVKIKKWSSMRGMDRTNTPMAFRFSNVERKSIEIAAAERLVRPSDIVRGCLIYAGIIPEVTVSDGSRKRHETDQLEADERT